MKWDSDEPAEDKIFPVTPGVFGIKLKPVA